MWQYLIRQTALCGSETCIIRIFKLSFSPMLLKSQKNIKKELNKMITRCLVIYFSLLLLVFPWYSFWIHFVFTPVFGLSVFEIYLRTIFSWFTGQLLHHVKLLTIWKKKAFRDCLRFFAYNQSISEPASFHYFCSHQQGAEWTL